MQSSRWGLVGSSPGSCSCLLGLGFWLGSHLIGNGIILNIINTNSGGFPNVRMLKQILK